MSSILVVEGEGKITNFIRSQFEDEGYHVVMVRNGDDAVQFAMREIPNLIIIKVGLPEIDGYQVIQFLRDHPKCMHIPIIMISACTSLEDKVRAYELGVDSYISIPYSNDELVAHMRRQLQRIQQSNLSPLTRLPGGLQLERAIDYKLRSSDPWSVLYLDLDNFKAFNDAYGFLAGNDMILLVGRICQRIVYEYGNADDFIGHVGGDDFVIVTTPDREKVLCRQILKTYKEESLVFYSREDIERGLINGIDRKGRPYQFPLVSLSIGVVSDQLCSSQSMDEVGSLTAEAKRLAKQSTNNVSFVSPEWRIPAQVSHAPQVAASYGLVGSVGRGMFQHTEEDVLARFK